MNQNAPRKSTRSTLQEVGLAVLLDRLEDHDPGVVDDDVEPAVAGDRGVDRALDVGVDGDVAGRRHRLAHAGGVQLLDRARRAFRLVVGDDDAGAVAAEAQAGRQADAGRAAGDDHHLVVEAHGPLPRDPPSLCIGAVRMPAPRLLVAGHGLLRRRALARREDRHAQAHALRRQHVAPVADDLAVGLADRPDVAVEVVTGRAG